MLCFRLFFQTLCLYLDIELSTHISQKAGGVPEIFTIPERWICTTYNFEDPDYHDLTPAANKSKIFHRSDKVAACQQPRDVICWQPEAYLRSYGLKLMYFLVLLEILFTILELAVELIKPCVGHHKGFTRPNPEYQEFIKNQELEKENEIENLKSVRINQEIADRNIRIENEKRIQKLLEMNAKLKDQLNNSNSANIEKSNPRAVDAIPQAGKMPSYLPASVETAIRNRLEGSKEK